VALRRSGVAAFRGGGVAAVAFVLLMGSEKASP